MIGFYKLHSEGAKSYTSAFCILVGFIDIDLSKPNMAHKVILYTVLKDDGNLLNIKEIGEAMLGQFIAERFDEAEIKTRVFLWDTSTQRKLKI